MHRLKKVTINLQMKTRNFSYFGIKYNLKSIHICKPFLFRLLLLINQGKSAYLLCVIFSVLSSIYLKCVQEMFLTFNYFNEETISL